MGQARQGRRDAGLAESLALGERRAAGQEQLGETGHVFQLPAFAGGVGMERARHRDPLAGMADGGPEQPGEGQGGAPMGAES